MNLITLNGLCLRSGQCPNTVKRRMRIAGVSEAARLIQSGRQPLPLFDFDQPAVARLLEPQVASINIEPQVSL